MHSQTQSLSKAEIRARCRKHRAQLTAEDQAIRSKAIIARLIASDLLDEPEIIHVYWPIIDRGEIDTRPLIDWLLKSGKTVAIPSSESSDPAGGMSSRVYVNPDRLEKNIWGTYQPLDATLVPPGSVNLCLVPALALDRSGNRIGYGGGFYDRFLNEAACNAVALVYSECLFDSIPFEIHDVRIPAIVTENELVTVDQSATSKPCKRND